MTVSSYLRPPVKIILSILSHSTAVPRYCAHNCSVSSSQHDTRLSYGSFRAAFTTWRHGSHRARSMHRGNWRRAKYSGRDAEYATHDTHGTWLMFSVTKSSLTIRQTLPLWANHRLLDVSYTSLDAQKDDSYTGRGRVTVYTELMSAALRPDNSWGKVSHGLIWRKCRIHIFNHSISMKRKLRATLLPPNFSIHRHCMGFLLLGA